MYKAIIIFFFCINVLNAFAQVRFGFNEDITLWKDGDFLLWNNGKAIFSNTDLCFVLRYEDERIGTPVCRHAGEFERDTNFVLYANWLSKNIDIRLAGEDLHPRNTDVIEKLRSLTDNILIFSTTRNDTAFFLLFDETSTEPRKLALAAPQTDSAAVLNALAKKWFSKKPERRLSAAERKLKNEEPDAYFAEQPLNDVWFGMGIGYNTAFKRYSSKVKNYRNVPDSASAWSFLESKTPLYFVSIGGAMFDFIGLEFFMRRSNHNVRIDKSDSIYFGLNYWNFSRYEFMLELQFTHSYKPHPLLEIRPHASLGFLYAIYAEDISLKNKYAGGSFEEYCYEHRFGFEKYYRGGSINAGVRTAFNKHYAIDFRTGIAMRGRSDIIAPDSEAGAKPPMTIGFSTIDGYISAAFEYHFRFK